MATRVVFSSLGTATHEVIVREDVHEIIEMTPEYAFSGASPWVTLTHLDGESHAYNAFFIRSIGPENATSDQWMSAGCAVVYAFLRLQGATTIFQQADALIELSNAIGDLSSWFPEYDYEAGPESVGQETP